MHFKYLGMKKDTQRDTCNPPFHIQNIETIAPKEWKFAFIILFWRKAKWLKLGGSQRESFLTSKSLYNSDNLSDHLPGEWRGWWWVKDGWITPRLGLHILALVKPKPHIRILEKNLRRITGPFFPLLPNVATLIKYLLFALHFFLCF